MVLPAGACCHVGPPLPWDPWMPKDLLHWNPGSWWDPQEEPWTLGMLLVGACCHVGPPLPWVPQDSLRGRPSLTVPLLRVCCGWFSPGRCLLLRAPHSWVERVDWALSPAVIPRRGCPPGGPLCCVWPSPGRRLRFPPAPHHGLCPALPLAPGPGSEWRVGGFGRCS